MSTMFPLSLPAPVTFFLRALLLLRIPTELFHPNAAGPAFMMRDDSVRACCSFEGLHLDCDHFDEGFDVEIILVVS
jgi:hypothetical protein